MLNRLTRPGADTFVWTKPRVTGRPPPDRVFAYGSSTCGKHLVLYGGFHNDTQRWLDDMYLLNTGMR